ncbi:MAG TPA: cupin domain-containing protein [Streptosporangiaceae bacterium]|jgi:mannose-6-phosphate isomerase-like protein (cupin superfamily)|nr:cupin domain-containing protein [Streptosporangiaceae bacterium]
MIDPEAPAVIVRSADAETLGNPDQPPAVRLLADSSATRGALSVQRVFLARGAEGANPHRHSGSSELFYILDGSAQILAGTEVVTVQQGDLAVVPPHLPHAFAATAGSGADLLVVITPGVERFGYFRLLARVLRGDATPDELLATQDRYDTYFLDSPEWQAARG